MTLDDLWTKVNANYSKVKSLSDKIALNLWDRVNGYDAWLSVQITWLTNKTYSTVYDLGGITRNALVQIQKMFQYGYALLDEKIDNAAGRIDSLFSTYMSLVIKYIQDAVNLVWAKAIEGGGDFKTYVDSAIAGVQSQLTSEVSALVSTIDSNIASVKNLITSKYNQVTAWVEETFGGVWDWITEGLDGLWSKTKTYADKLFTDAKAAIKGLYDDLEDAIIAVRASIINYYEQVKTYAETLFADAKDFINIAIGNLERAIIRAADEIKIWVNGLIDKVNAGIKAAIGIVQDALDELSILSDWRFGFFNWFVVRPELFMLNVLTRTDEIFNYWKPYWQAFFARVLEEA